MSVRRHLIPAATVALALPGCFPPTALGHDYPFGISGRVYEGFGTHGKHVDLTASTSGRRVGGVVIRGRMVCRGRQRGRPYRQVHSDKQVIGSIRVRRERFRWRRSYRLYTGRQTRSLRGRFSRRGRVVTVTYRDRTTFNNSFRVGACTTRVKLRARRFAPADYDGKTSQGLPISFRLGAFKGPAPLTRFRLQALLRCDNGQTLSRSYNWPAPPLTMSTNSGLGDKVRFYVSGQLPGAGGLTGTLHASRRKGTYVSGKVQPREFTTTVDPATGERVDVTCDAGEVSFKARRK